jgi:hypothetical protein
VGRPTARALACGVGEQGLQEGGVVFRARVGVGVLWRVAWARVCLEQRPKPRAAAGHGSLRSPAEAKSSRFGGVGFFARLLLGLRAAGLLLGWAAAGPGSAQGKASRS